MIEQLFFNGSIYLLRLICNLRAVGPPKSFDFDAVDRMVPFIHYLPGNYSRSCIVVLWSRVRISLPKARAGDDQYYKQEDSFCYQSHLPPPGHYCRVKRILDLDLRLSTLPGNKYYCRKSVAFLAFRHFKDNGILFLNWLQHFQIPIFFLNRKALPVKSKPGDALKNHRNFSVAGKGEDMTAPTPARVGSTLLVSATSSSQSK